MNFNSQINDGSRTDAKFLQQLCDKIPSEQMQRDLPIFFREAQDLDRNLVLDEWFLMDKIHNR